MEKDVAKAPREAAVSVHRCPFCRDDVGRADSVVCADCLTRHHEGCWGESGERCGSCQGPRKLAPEPLTLSVAVRLLEEQGYGAEQVRALLVAPPAAARSAPGLGAMLVRRLLIPLLLFLVPLGLSALVGVGLCEGFHIKHSHSASAAVAVMLGALASGGLIGTLAMLVALRRS